MTPHDKQAGHRTGRRFGLFGLWGRPRERESFDFAVDVPGIGMRDGEAHVREGFHEICAWLGEHCLGAYTSRALIVDGHLAGRTFLFEVAADAELLRARQADRLSVPPVALPASGRGPVLGGVP